MQDVGRALVSCDLQRGQYTQMEGIAARDKGKLLQVMCASATLDNVMTEA